MTFACLQFFFLHSEFQLLQNDMCEVLGTFFSFLSLDTSNQNDFPICQMTKMTVKGMRDHRAQNIRMIYIRSQNHHYLHLRAIFSFMLMMLTRSEGKTTEEEKDTKKYELNLQHIYVRLGIGNMIFIEFTDTHQGKAVEINLIRFEILAKKRKDEEEKSNNA